MLAHALTGSSFCMGGAKAPPLLCSSGSKGQGVRTSANATTSASHGHGRLCVSCSTSGARAVRSYGALTSGARRYRWSRSGSREDRGEATTVCRALDASQASTVASILKPAISVASFFMIVRIVLTWFPETKSKEFPWLLFYYTTEPVLGFTRQVFQPVGGVDISPIIWVSFLSFMNEILVGPQGILILLQNKV